MLYMPMPLDGYIAGPNDEVADPGGDGFERLHRWKRGCSTSCRSVRSRCSFWPRTSSVRAAACARRACDRPGDRRAGGHVRPLPRPVNQSQPGQDDFRWEVPVSNLIDTRVAGHGFVKSRVHGTGLRDINLPKRLERFACRMCPRVLPEKWRVRGSRREAAGVRPRTEPACSPATGQTPWSRR